MRRRPRAFVRARIVLVESRIDAAQNGFEWYARLTPRFYQRPVQRIEQKNGATATAEALFDLGEVFKIILHDASGADGGRDYAPR